jgi:hypothetical protein
LPSDVEVKLPASEEEVEDGDAEEPEHSNWVQCSRCEAWRLVPDEFWPDIDAAGEEDWFCNVSGAARPFPGHQLYSAAGQGQLKLEQSASLHVMAGPLAHES